MYKDKTDRFADRPVYHWLDHDVIVRKEKTIKNISGRTVTLVVEIRQPKNTFDLKVRMGRPSTSTVDKITKSLWVEDIPELMLLVDEAMREVVPHYERLKKEQVDHQISNETKELREKIKSDPSDWRNALEKFEDSL